MQYYLIIQYDINDSYDQPHPQLYGPYTSKFKALRELATYMREYNLIIDYESSWQREKDKYTACDKDKECPGGDQVYFYIQQNKPQIPTL